MMTCENGDYVDWRGKKTNPVKHGGIRAAVLVCVVEVLENMVFIANASTLVGYFLKSMHYSAAESSNMVTNFMGTSFLLTILGGFLCDSFFTRFTTFIFFCLTEILGLMVLTIQAHEHQNLRSVLVMNRKPSRSQVGILYTGLYAMAIGIGGIKASLPTHGAEQLDRNNQRLISSFFNWFFFSLCSGGLLASTIMVWVEENKGWNWSFTISIVALCLALCIFLIGTPIFRNRRPRGSPFTRVLKVIYSAIQNWRASPVERPAQVNPETNDKQSHYKFLDKALINTSINVADVDETRTFVGLLPIFASTIMMNCCLAQLQTFSVQQGNIMNRTLTHNFKIPTQSLTILPLTIMLCSIPLYERFVQILGLNQHTRKAKYFKPLWRIGFGLTLASISMAVAAIIEAKRRGIALKNNESLSVFWLGWQYLFLGVSDMLTLGGMLEFFYSEAPNSMRSTCTALSWCSTSMGYFLSTVLVQLTNSVSKRFGRVWIGGNDLNDARLDLFYTLLALLTFLNLINYMYWAKRYYRISFLL